MNSRMIEKTIFFLKDFDSVLDRDNEIIMTVLVEFVLIVLGFWLFPIWFTETLIPASNKLVKKKKRVGEQK